MNNKIDVHNLTLDDAKKYIVQAINISYQKGYSILEVIHGFNNGNKIKTWCLKSGTKLNHVIKVESGENEGISKFFIDFKIF